MLDVSTDGLCLIHDSHPDVVAVPEFLEGIMRLPDTVDALSSRGTNFKAVAAGLRVELSLTALASDTAAAAAADLPDTEGQIIAYLLRFAARPTYTGAPGSIVGALMRATLGYPDARGVADSRIFTFRFTEQQASLLFIPSTVNTGTGHRRASKSLLRNSLAGGGVYGTATPLSWTLEVLSAPAAPFDLAAVVGLFTPLDLGTLKACL